MTIVCNIVFLLKDDQVLLGLKKRGFGANLWNGYGGKVQAGEQMEAAAKRELLEESGVTANALVSRGHLDFRFEDGTQIDVSIFSCTDFSGEPMETEEMRPQWYAYPEVPYGQMWDDDKLWLPRFLAGENITGKFHFDANNKVKSYELK